MWTAANFIIEGRRLCTAVLRYEVTHLSTLSLLFRALKDFANYNTNTILTLEAA